MLNRSELRISAVGAAIAIGAFSIPSSAYNISLKGRMHERMTVKAEQCLAEAGGAKPTRCDIGKPEGKLRGQWKSPLARATRWSDDPTRQAQPLGAAKFLVNMSFGGCKSALRPDGQDTAEPYFAGLLCNSHFGAFQFMHAMSGMSDEPKEVTLANMLAWSDVTYGVATGRISSDVDYCEQFSAGSAIDPLMKPDSFPFCSTSDTVEGPEKKGWRVHTLFSLACNNPLSSANCTEYLGDNGAAMARSNATGALLHMVQDSFSQAHAVRGPAPKDNSFEARVDCMPVERFYNYNEQIADDVKHSKADKRPKFASSCFQNGTIDDPVTASAILLWHIRQNSDPSEVRAYLSDRVFGAS